MCRPPTIIPAKANGTGDCACYFDIKVDGIGLQPVELGPSNLLEERLCGKEFPQDFCHHAMAECIPMAVINPFGQL